MPPRPTHTPHPLQDGYALIPRTCEYVSYRQRDYAHVIKVKDLEILDYPDGRHLITNP